MGRYRKVGIRIWNDEKFMALPDLTKLQFFFLLTHPSMTSVGAMRASLAGLAEELHWSHTQFKKRFQRLADDGMADYDPAGPLVVLPNFLKHNPPENPNVVKSWGSLLDLIPECPLKAALLAQVPAFIATLPKGFREALPEPFRKGMPIPVPEPLPEPERTTTARLSARDVPGQAHENYRVISRLVRTVFDEDPNWVTSADLTDEIKVRCARAHIDYEATTVGRAIASESTKWRRRAS